MNILTRVATAGAAALVVAVPTVVAATPAHADTEKHVPCGGGHLELGVDRTGNGWEVEAQVDHVKPRQEWRFVLKHDGNRIYTGVRVTDVEGDADVDHFRRDTEGSEKFRVKAVRLSDGTACSTQVVVG